MTINLRTVTWISSIFQHANKQFFIFWHFFISVRNNCVQLKVNFPKLDYNVQEWFSFLAQMLLFIIAIKNVLWVLIGPKKSKHCWWDQIRVDIMIFFMIWASSISLSGGYSHCSVSVCPVQLNILVIGSASVPYFLFQFRGFQRTGTWRRHN